MKTIEMKSIGLILCGVLICLPAGTLMGSAVVHNNTAEGIDFKSTVEDLESRLLSALPNDIDIRLMVRNGTDIVTQVRALAASPAVAESGWFAQLTSNPQFNQARLMLLGVASAANTDAWSSVGSVLGDRFAIGVNIDETGEPHFVMISAGGDTDVRDRVIQQVMAFVGGGNATAEANQINVIGEMFYARTDDNALAISNDRTMIRNIIDNENDQTGSQILSSISKFVPSDASAWLQVSEKFINAALASSGNFTTQPNQPLTGFVFGDWLHALDNATDGLVWVEFHDQSLTISTVVDSDTGMPESHRGLKGTFSYGPQVWSGQSIEGYVGQVVLSRQWADLFSERETLLDAVGAGQAVNFTTTLTSIMGGLDVMDDFLPAINGPINLIVARQNFASLGFTPNPQLPAFALITPLDMSKTKNLGKRLRSGTLSALSIFSMQMTNDNQPAYTIAMGTHHDVEMVWTEYSYGDEEENLETTAMLGPQYNFAPCTAIVKDRFVIATSVQLMNDIIELSETELELLQVPKTASGAILVQSAGVTSILQDNRDAMIASNMLEKNNSKEQASKEIDLMFTLIEMTQALTVTSTPFDQGGVQATIQLKFEDFQKSKRDIW